MTRPDTSEPPLRYHGREETRTAMAARPLPQGRLAANPGPRATPWRAPRPDASEQPVRRPSRTAPGRAAIARTPPPRAGRTDPGRRDLVRKPRRFDPCRRRWDW